MPERVVRWVVTVALGATAACRSGSPPERAVVEGATIGERNVLGDALDVCGSDPLTGYFRDGRCVTGPTDRGTHVVCAKVDRSFLDFTASRGNDLVTPRPDHRFPGLVPGDRWCVCALRWREALDAGVAPEVILEATERHALDHVSESALRAHASGSARR